MYYTQLVEQVVFRIAAIPGRQRGSIRDRRGGAVWLYDVGKICGGSFWII